LGTRRRRMQDRWLWLGCKLCCGEKFGRRFVLASEAYPVDGFHDPGLTARRELYRLVRKYALHAAKGLLEFFAERMLLSGCGFRRCGESD